MDNLTLPRCCLHNHGVTTIKHRLGHSGPSWFENNYLLHFNIKTRNIMSPWDGVTLRGEANFLLLFCFVLFLPELQRIICNTGQLSNRVSLVVQMVKNMPAMRETWVRSLDWEDALEKGMATHSSILAWRIHEQRSLACYSPWGLKESDMTERLTHTTFKSVSCDSLRDYVQQLNIVDCSNREMLYLS